MRLHEKLAGVRLLRPDVIVVPECACPEVLLRRIPELEPSGIAWTGLRANKGLAAFSFGPWRLAVDPAHDPRGATTIALRVGGPASFRLLAVWAMPPWGRRSGSRRPEPLARALARLSPFLASSPSAIAGDFSGALAAPRTDGRVVPSELFKRIEALRFVCACGHPLRSREDHAGRPTYYRNRRSPKELPSDLVFVDVLWAASIEKYAIGHPFPWIRASDHAPVAVNILLASIPGQR